MLRLLGVDLTPISRGGSPDELKRLIRESQAGGQLEAGEATMLSGVFHLHEQEARQVMTPIPAVVTVDISEDVETALRRCIDSGHTRLLVTEDENPDRIRGVVHANGLARRLLDKGPHASIEPLVRDAPIVPETKPLDDLLAELQRQRTPLAVVVDEYGRVVGIVTVEDIVEEVVGEITDETDPAAGDVRQLPTATGSSAGTCRSPTSPTTASSCRPTTPTTRSAASCSPTRAAAQRGDKIDVNGYELRVESVRENRIVAVRIRERRRPRRREDENAPRRRTIARRSERRRTTSAARRPEMLLRNTSGPRGGAGRTVCTGRRRVCIATVSQLQVSPR